MFHDNPGIVADTSEQRGAESGLEMQTDEVESASFGYNPVIVKRIAVVAEDRYLDPPKIRMVTGCPHDPIDVEDLTVLQHRQTVSDCPQPGTARDS